MKKARISFPVLRRIYKENDRNTEKNEKTIIFSHPFILVFLILSRKNTAFHNWKAVFHHLLLAHIGIDFLLHNSIGTVSKLFSKRNSRLFAPAHIDQCNNGKNKD